MPKLSIISPAYNVGPYISKFLDSLEKQTFQDYEIIFVYDKSDDNSLEQIQSFKNKNIEKVKIINNVERLGVGFAKDLGFKHSSPNAKYVLFLDSDDCFDDDYFEKLVLKAEQTKADITCSGYLRINEKDNSIICKEMINNPEMVISLDNPDFPLCLLNTAAWNKLFLKERIEQCSFGYSKHAEDLYFFIQALISSRSIAFINEPLYKYFIHEGSLINTITYEKYLNTLENFKKLISNRVDTNSVQLISSFVFIRIGLGTTLRTCQAKEKKIKDIVKETKNYLKENFVVFSKNKYLTLHYLKKAGKKGVAIYLTKQLYKMNLFGLAARYYIRRTNKSKKEIRW